MASPSYAVPHCRSVGREMMWLAENEWCSHDAILLVAGTEVTVFLYISTYGWQTDYLRGLSDSYHRSQINFRPFPDLRPNFMKFPTIPGLKRKNRIPDLFPNAWEPCKKHTASGNSEEAANIVTTAHHYCAGSCRRWSAVLLITGRDHKPLLPK